MKTLITQTAVSKTFKDYRGRKLHVLQKISLEINEGEFFVLLGPSGCGKSTLLRIMSGLEQKFEGTQTYTGVTNRDFSFVFQQFALMPWLTVRENIALGLTARGTLTAKDTARVSALIRTLGLESFANEYPKGLSGGMKQRVGIARALAIQPKIMFLDEPFSALDSFTAAALRQELLNLWKEHGMTIVMVTHNIEEAVQLADRIGVMSARPGQLEAIVSNTLPRPREMRSQEFYDIVDSLADMVKV